MTIRTLPLTALLAFVAWPAAAPAAPPAGDAQQLLEEMRRLAAEQQRLAAEIEQSGRVARQAIEQMHAAPTQPPAGDPATAGTAPRTRDIVKVPAAPDLSTRGGFRPHHLARCSQFLDAQPAIDRELGAPAPLTEEQRVQVRDLMRNAFTYLVAPDEPKAAWDRIAGEERSAWQDARSAGRQGYVQFRNARVRLCGELVNDHADEITRRLNEYQRELQRSR